MSYDLIVIGGGIAGSAAALRAAQYGVKTAWILGDKGTRRRSRSQWVANIDNMIGVHPGIVKDKVLKLLKKPEYEAARKAIEEAHLHISTRDIIGNTISRIEAEHSEFVDCVEGVAVGASRGAEGFEISLASGAGLCGTAVVLATGVMDMQPNIKKAKGAAVVDVPKWVYPYANRESVLYCIRCEGHLTRDTRSGIIGHSEVAAQVGLMLYERYASTASMFTNGETPGWKQETAAALDRYGILVHTERITELEGRKGKLGAVHLEGGTRIELKFAFVSLGLFRVYNELAVQLGASLTNPELPTELRHVQINETAETDVRGLFAVGDMTRHADRGVMKQVYTAQEYAVRAVDRIDYRRRKAAR